MKLKELRFLADENIHADVAAHLRSLGCDVIAVNSSGLTGAPDDQVLAAAVREQRVVLTHDSDFGELTVARREPVVGIMYLRPGHIDPTFTVATIDAVAAANLDLRPPFLLVARRTGQDVRIRLRDLSGT